MNQGAARSVTSTEKLRRDNLALVLGLVHREGPLARAEITRLTGLNRSTVGGLVVGLTELGFVYEAAPTGVNPPGRPSLIVHADPRIVAIAINPEVDAIHVGLVGLSGRLVARVRLDTTRVPTPAEVVATASTAIAGLVGDRDIRVVGIGVAVPGQVRLADGAVSEATHMGWVDEPLSALLAESTGYPTWAANAANLGMRAESVFGAGKDVDDFVYLIGGASGIGGGAVVGGEQLTGAAGYAGEFGHTFVRSNGTACSCGSRGCLEAEVTQARLLDVVGLAPAEINQLGARLAASSDPAVRALVAQQLELLGAAIRTVVNAFNPTVVVLGGFLADLHEAAGEAGAATLLAGAVRSVRAGVRIERAVLGSEQLMIGAGELVFARLLADPAAPAH